MIARLKGLVDAVGEDWLIVDVGGVGYLVFASARTLGALPGLGEPVALDVETHVREDHIHLYGFTGTAEKDQFSLLTSVQGVGAKMALSVLSVLGPQDLADAIAHGDKTALTRANGVGPKVAQRLINELADKMPALPGSMPGLAGGAGGPGGSAMAGRAAAPGGGVAHDAVSALVNLGYRPADAQAAVARLIKDAERDPPLADLIRQGLRELAS
ncbi:Holliday junction DNA helicase subunit RuvA [Rhodothalassium salexigens DSM 2132]|uniref:Holliday junction branch migration complex subunit RuvA n=1 Tax=Rhodothalassium salexigens DSM 2132 TaxID=1188247 RepID=A0A4R2PPD1_RHOSA|nr:Holliday junction branch migration protein RuvA [Rhodothalassium salexigens]MBB4210816.1 Holliday junction DNA helicase RuvA [Rhodothalassium salexigens DSM 2132]MBK1639423.1 Holliday junction branch migration protein RuvA [Rhodothalassium salexigens DSM 2132]TCP37629.1 Holliday junction DNA helicase subunit RuvA [Rhodothalassium salexigens DSM 2132]